MKKSLLLLSFFCLWLSGGVLAQNTMKQCGMEQLRNQLIASYPYARQYFDTLPQYMQTLTEAYLEAKHTTANKVTSTITIPVVFHIVLRQAQINQLGGEAGIRERVLSQIEALNEDFNKLNPDLSQVPSAFVPLIGNANIKFGLAHRMPNGLSTEGYEIIVTEKPGFELANGTTGSGFAGSDAKYAISGGANAWETSKYLNIWVINPIVSGGALTLGVAVPPYIVNNFGVPSAEKGIVLHYGAFGRRTSSSQFFLSNNDKGRTLTHEIGHMLGLFHIWGDVDGCPPGSPDDGIADTPPQEKANFNCPVYPSISCSNGPNGDMFMNFMDYVDDPCMFLFTQGQVDRMQTMLSLPQESLGLTQHPELLEWPTSVWEAETQREVYFYPNPVDEGRLTITLSNIVGLREITVTNIMGQPVAPAIKAIPQNNKYDIDLTHCNSGVYFVRCIFESESLIRKIIVK